MKIISIIAPIMLVLFILTLIIEGIMTNTPDFLWTGVALLIANIIYFLYKFFN